ncbi:DUF4345 domain-containing protein [Rhodocytophaga rosea]|uniref:DUF4345 domain-containing protein n=1 Tax=Rhodocytophaga rosea TaxID=2704465 RepID=A0A6C0GPX7_9BACT|nr:DUF4345 domain-containing protein [Rhodocytophaga rosea]QHT70116.1 DUF4345 domain-containing protein [Rhodocytophaga rosea]
MTTKKILHVLSLCLIGLCASGILMVSIMAFINPQSVMALVGVSLPNTDAYSSIRGVYGGAGLTICIILVYLAIKNSKQGLLCMALLCSLYAISRLITIFAEGNLGEFGQQWLLIESSMAVLALLVYGLRANYEKYAHRTSQIIATS